MGLTVVTQDFDALPVAMLAEVKEHLRVTWTWDDAQIKRSIAGAIDEIERASGMHIAPISAKWKPSFGDFAYAYYAELVPPTCYARSPLAPVKTFTVAAADAADITADFALEHRSIRGAPVDYFIGSYSDGIEFTITAGFVNMSDMSPGVRDVVYRLTAHLFENRDILVENRLSMTPDWLGTALSTFWIPRA